MNDRMAIITAGAQGIGIAEIPGLADVFVGLLVESGVGDEASRR